MISVGPSGPDVDEVSLPPHEAPSMPSERVSAPTSSSRPMIERGSNTRTSNGASRRASEHGFHEALPGPAIAAWGARRNLPRAYIGARPRAEAGGSDEIDREIRREGVT